MNTPYAICIGGVLNGQVRPCQGSWLKVPIASHEWVMAYGEWQDLYGVAWEAENCDSIKADPITPPPPDMPVQTYTLSHVGNDYIWMLEVAS